MIACEIVVSHVRISSIRGWLSTTKSTPVLCRFEADRVGGRTQADKIDGRVRGDTRAFTSPEMGGACFLSTPDVLASATQIIEMGASIIHEQNAYLR